MIKNNKEMEAENMWEICKKLLQREGGSAYVELAILLPILLFLIFGIIEAGLVAEAENSLVAVVNYGIRAMAVNGGLNDKIQQNIEEQLKLQGIDPALVELK